ncbi:MAG: PilZ domain-containing protein [Bryobacterales bacterium]|nr:PilZ domain-containing protein [Bryobacterales bacterium]
MDQTGIRVTVERRAGIRFPLQFPLSCRSLGRARKLVEGTTLNFSRRGLLFAADDPPGPGEKVEVSVDWPTKIDGVCPLKLVLQGRVVRSWGRYAAVRFMRYEFRTRGRQAMTLALEGRECQTATPAC